MNTKKVSKILGIISIIIIVFGIIAGADISSKLKSTGDSTDKVYVDGSDFTATVDAVGTIGSSIIGFIVFLYCAFIVGGIWIVYGVIILTVKIINKRKK